MGVRSIQEGTVLYAERKSWRAMGIAGNGGAPKTRLIIATRKMQHLDHVLRIQDATISRDVQSDKVVYMILSGSTNMTAEMTPVRE